jgi:non-ribosomal peptide synthetase-like protein
VDGDATAKDAAVLASAGNWSPIHLSGERFHDVFEHRCAQLGGDVSRHLAVDYGEMAVTFSELRDRANRLARFFVSRGVASGGRIGLLLDRSVDSYAAVLAASKIGAAYVPLDASFPPDRIAFMLNDSAVSLVVTLRSFASHFSEGGTKVLALDDCYDEINQLSPGPFKAEPGSLDPDPLAYIIYTSGSTGRPKGVPIRHSSICNFMHIASELYGYRPSDRVYQGMTIAFDFSFEEVWVPLVAGATLVPAPSQAKLLGDDLKDFLTSRRVTALCCVPTLLATLEPDFPQLRFLLVSGEACPADVIAKWLIPGRRVLNAYGPTETTVTATWSLVEPGKPITIGGPLPTYSVVIVDPDTGWAVEPGESGEVCIGGVALFDGYLNRPEQTDRAFIPDFLGLPDNPSGRLYRTGDLGRINDANEIEYLGRIDTQVKIRGYRIELSEIESVARAVNGVEQAVVQPFDLDGTGTVLAAYLTPTHAGERLDMAKVDAALRAALPAYMIPAYYQQLDTIPLLPSTKADRKALPRPTGIRFSAPATTLVEARTAREGELAQLLAGVLKLGQVSITANFFNELGADSLTMAAYITAIRKQLGLRQISMRQLYEHPSIAELAAVLEDSEAEAGAKKDSEPAAAADPAGPKRAAERHGAAPHVASDWVRMAVGVAQLVVFTAELFVILLAMVALYHWVEAGDGLADVYLRAALATNLVFFGTAAMFILIKWLAVGRFTTEPVPIWGGRYLRFWIARRAVQFNPLNLFVGTPIYSGYLRLLGMGVGRDTLILSMPPVCTDLVSIGANSVVRQDVAFPGYTAYNGYLYPGTISIGSNALICEATVLDIFTSVGDDAQLGMVSALVEGQTVPTAAVYQGSPAEPSQSNFNRVPPCRPSPMRKAVFAMAHLLNHCLVSPIWMMAVVLLIDWSHTSGLLAFENIVALSAISYVGALALAMTVILVIPRLLNLFVVPGVAHPLYSVQYELARSIARISNSKLFNMLFGDSSMILHWLSAVGYDLSRSTQSGSNFGVAQLHHSPFLCEFDRNTLVADGMMLLNMEASSTSFILRKIAVPPDTYFGNSIHYPADAQLGPNCLIATKAAIPVDGPVRTNVGLLGSPVFEIPRSVARDQRFDHYKQPDILKQRLAMKLRSNLVTLGLYLLRSWVLVAMGLLLILACFHVFGADLSGATLLSTALALTIAVIAFVVLAALFCILCERLVCGFRRLEPRYCSLYEPGFWSHERYWKQGYNEALAVFDGTPIKPLFLRLQGAIVGRRLFDDGSGFAEPSMVEIGDDCTFNQGAFVQCHSLEDGTFKSDRVRLGSRCTLGPNTFVQYGTVMHDDTLLEANALLMKGSVMEPGTRWIGNPARETTPQAAHDYGLSPVQVARQRHPYILAGAALDALKIFAMVLMGADHVNEVVFKESLPWLTYLGYGAFPLFAYSLACDLLQKAKKDDLVGHLVVLALVSQPVYFLAFQENCLNMLFTLGLGTVVGMWLLRQPGIWYAVFGMLATFAFFFKDAVEFGVAGIVLPGMLACAMAGYRFAWVWVFGLLFLLNMDLGDFAKLNAGALGGALKLSHPQMLSILATYIVPAAVYAISRMFSGQRFLNGNIFYLAYPGYLLLLSLYRLWEQPIPFTLFSW